VRDPSSFDPDDFYNTFVEDIRAAQMELLELKSDVDIADSHPKPTGAHTVVNSYFHQ